MKNNYLTFFFLLVSLARILAAENKTDSARNTKVTRTVLHIARSLDPSKTEYLNVKSRDGNVATLIVKKREGRKENQTEVGKSEVKVTSSPRIQDAPTLLRAGKANLPQPVNVRSSEILVKDSIAITKKKGRQLSTMTIDSDGVPVIEGLREPDDEMDKVQTWRNARVIDGVLVPNKQQSSIYKASDKKDVTLVPNQPTDKPVSMFHVDDAITSQWKGIAETTKVRPVNPIPINGQETPSKLIEYITKINNKESNRRKTARNFNYDAERRMDENVDENDEPMYVNSQPKEIWTEHGTIKVADRRMDDEKVRISASLPLEARHNDEDVDEEEDIDGEVDQARLLHNPGFVNYPSSSFYSRQPSRVSFEGVRTPVLQYAHPELGVQPAKVAKEPDSAEVDKPRLPPIKYFANDPHADRSPYAFEPGLAEDTLTDNANKDAPEVPNAIDNNSYHKNDIRNIEFTTSTPGKTVDPSKVDITEPPRRSFSYEKKLYEDTYGVGNDKYVKRYPYVGYSGNYAMSKDDYYKWKMSGMGHGKGHKSYYVKVKDDRPFWEKIGDSIKETVQSGVESVKDLTRPVVEPIYEATQKISENLGINEASARISNSLGLNQGSGMRTAIQEKIGVAVSGNPVLLPALGLVAGGAALGLGAVAVGRLFDTNIDLLKRSENGEGTVADLEAEHKRALSAIQNRPEDHILVSDINKKDDQSVVLVPKDGRSLPLDNDKKKQAKDEFKRLIDESGIEGLERFHFNVNEDEGDHQSHRRSVNIRQKRVRRAAKKVVLEKSTQSLNNVLDDGKKDEFFMSKLASLSHPNAWTRSDCAKRMFCDVMTTQSLDTILLTEKTITKFLSESKPPVSHSVRKQLEEVMLAVMRRDCKQYVCRRYR